MCTTCAAGVGSAALSVENWVEALHLLDCVQVRIDKKVTFLKHMLLSEILVLKWDKGG